MKLPINWLKEYVDTTLSPEEIGEKLTQIGHMQDGKTLGSGDTAVIDLEVRQNRPDCLSIIGLARELAAATGAKLTLPPVATLPDSDSDGLALVEDNNDCLRFHVVKISNLGVKKTPTGEISSRLKLCGMEPTSALVNITNYVMLEWGQPLHAFDAKKIKGKLVVRRASEGDVLTIIGGRKIKLTGEDLIIADDTGPQALAGIIGGENSRVTAETTEILLEAATYNQSLIRRSSRRHSLRTEASTRLEKFLHPELTTVALSRAIYLLKQSFDLSLTSRTDFYPKPLSPLTVDLALDDLHRIAGFKISLSDASKNLSNLKIDAETNSGTLTATIPFFRTDLEIAADLAEEVLRMYGYENIESKLPALPTPKNIDSPFVEFENEIRDVLIGSGFSEEITEPLLHYESPEKSTILLENSLTADRDMLRTSLLQSLVVASKHRAKYREKNTRLFEIGRIYFKEGGKFGERRTLGLYQHSQQFNFYDLKGTIELLFQRLGRELDPSIYNISSIEGNYYIELNIEALYDLKKSEQTKVLTKPAQLIFHDFSFFLPSKQSIGKIISYLKKLDPLIYEVTLSETPRLIDNKQTVLLHISFGDTERAIKNEDVATVRTKIINALTEKFNAEMRL